MIRTTPGPGAAPTVSIVRGIPDYSRENVEAAVDGLLRRLVPSFDEMVRPGDRVLLKPNLIRESHTQRPDEWDQIITNAAVIQAVARRVAFALGGRGQILIADAPQSDSDFALIRHRAGLDDVVLELEREFPELRCEVHDLRRVVWKSKRGVAQERTQLPDASGGYVCVDLGSSSSFAGKAARYYGADYDSAFTHGHHSNGKHEYLLARMALDVDVFINLPKLKTHKKVGITVSLKNLVGINGDKNYLPHFAFGTPCEGGDEFPSDSLRDRIQSRGIRAFKTMARTLPWWSGSVGGAAKSAGALVFGKTEDVVRSGNWHGNDTAWRMVLDLNRVLFHYDGDGQRRRRPLRYISIVDGIVAGEGNGPMEADRKPCGILLAGTHPVAVDWVAATLMGFDWMKIPMIREAFAFDVLPLAEFRPTDIRVLPELGSPLSFRPHFGWKGHVESPEWVS